MGQFARNYVVAIGRELAAKRAVIDAEARKAKEQLEARQQQLKDTAAAERAISLSNAGPGRWQTKLDKSLMDDSPTVALTLTADTAVKVWLKQVVPTLSVRCKEKRLDTYVVVGTAAAVESGDSRTVRVRFDMAPAETEAWGQSSDHDALFAPEPEVMLDKLRSTSRFLFEFTPFNAPPVIVSFTPRGLESSVGKLLDACPETTKIRHKSARRAGQLPS